MILGLELKVEVMRIEVVNSDVAVLASAAVTVQQQQKKVLKWTFLTRLNIMTELVDNNNNNR